MPSGCYCLTVLQIPEGVTQLEQHVFAGCNSLQEVHIPDSVTSIASQSTSSRQTQLVVGEGSIAHAWAQRQNWAYRLRVDIPAFPVDMPADIPAAIPEDLLMGRWDVALVERDGADVTAQYLAATPLENNAFVEFTPDEDLALLFRENGQSYSAAFQEALLLFLADMQPGEQRAMISAVIQAMDNAGTCHGMSTYRMWICCKYLTIGTH